MKSAAESDFGNGVAVGDLPDGAMLQGKVGDDDVLLVRRGDEFFAVGAHCTHYGGPLAKGTHVGRRVAMPAASRLLQPTDGKGIARPGIRCHSALARGKNWQHCVRKGSWLRFEGRPRFLPAYKTYRPRF